MPSALDSLTDEYDAWLTAQGIEAGCAEELLHDADHGAHGKKLTAEQRAWLVAFILRWDATARAPATAQEILTLAQLVIATHPEDSDAAELALQVTEFISAQTASE